MAPVVPKVHMEACCRAFGNPEPMKALPGIYVCVVCKLVVSIAVGCSDSRAVLCHKNPFPFQNSCILLWH